MSPHPSGQGPLYTSRSERVTPGSEQVTHGAGPSSNALPSGAGIPLVLVLHTTLAGDGCALPTFNESGLDIRRLLLERLKVLTAALQQVRELQRSAAEAPAESQ